MNSKFNLFIAGRLFQSGSSRYLGFVRIIAVMGVILGNVALIISLSVLDGFDKSLRENAVKFSADINISFFGGKTIPNPFEVASHLKSEFPEIRTVNPVIQREGLIRSSSYIDGAVLRGIENSSKPSGIVDKIVEGKFDFDSNTSKEIVIGRDLAKKLNVSVGNKVMLIVMSKDSAIRNFSPDIEEFNVKGIYHTGMTLYDETVVFMPSGTATEFFHQMPGSASYLEIMLDDINKSPVISKAIMDDFGYPYYATTIFERHAAMFAWIDLQKEPIPIVLGLITIVAVFNIITILLITIVEKTHSVGILRALGMPSGQLLKIFVIQGLILGVIGTIIGCLLGFSFFYIQDVYKLIHLKGEIYYLDTLPVAFSAWHYVIVGGFSILLSFLASIVPASISLRISPIKAIRFK